ncbi:hypothetical protein E2C01_075601 [Portunus trituberculatus]|uniref:Uncharacterized protein n=1 Tax=Portunus trituberculatus TaxID=210409 RepID=A0A5B7I6I0_PORTR|nr:hypothetical protein [Portunus trituberculatus]
MTLNFPLKRSQSIRRWKYRIKQAGSSRAYQRKV